MVYVDGNSREEVLVLAIKNVPPIVDTGESSAECRHYWIIDAPGGATNRGVCNQCGAERRFSSYLESSGWETGGPAINEMESIRVLAAVASDELDGEE